MHWLRRAVVISTVVLALSSAWAAAPLPRSALLIDQSDTDSSWYGVFSSAFRSTLNTSPGTRVSVYAEHLDLSRFGGPRHDELMRSYLRDKFRDKPIGVVVAQGSSALEFVVRARAELWPQVPVVFASVDEATAARLPLPPDVTGATYQLTLRDAVASAKALVPGLKRIALVGDPLERQAVRSHFKQEIPVFAAEFELIDLMGLPMAELRKRVAALPQDAAIIYTAINIDGAGVAYIPHEALAAVAEAANRPIVIDAETSIGYGGTGGLIVSAGPVAEEAAQRVLRILGGEEASRIPITKGSFARPIFDWRQLQRFAIDERSLPPGSDIRFRPPSMWTLYRWQIIATAMVLLLQVGLILALLLGRRSRLLTAKALEASQEQMNLAARAARLSFWSWDTTRGEIRTTAGSREPYRGLNGRPIPFEQVVRSVHPADRESFQRAVARTLTTGEEFDIEYRTVEGDGGVRWIAARGRAQNGDSRTLSGVALDITERVAAELQAAEDHTALRHMTRVSMVGQLSAAVAHQLNQPLAAILGNAEAAQKMLGRENLDLTELREICNDIVSEDHRATEVIRRLSALYRRGDMKVEPIDLNELIRETLDLLRTELLIRHLTPATHLVPGLPVIEGGYVQLQQVVLNLVINAADAMTGVRPEDRRLSIRTESSGTDVRLYIVDNGSGIAPEHLKAVFEAFWSTKAEGMGMGLAICKSIVAAHHGNITATNNAEGGATFRVSLPVSRQT